MVSISVDVEAVGDAFNVSQPVVYVVHGVGYSRHLGLESFDPLTAGGAVGGKLPPHLLHLGGQVAEGLDDELRAPEQDCTKGGEEVWNERGHGCVFIHCPSIHVRISPSVRSVILIGSNDGTINMRTVAPSGGSPPPS